MELSVHVILAFWLGLFFFISAVTANFQPVITNLPGKARIYENVTIDTVIFKVEANDTDPNTTADGVLIFNFGYGNQKRKFSMDAQNGEVRVTRPLDFEGTKVYEIKVRVKNLGQGGGQAAEGLLTIQIDDVNDNPPVCTPNQVLGQLNEDSPINTTFTQLNCSDVDSGDGGKIEYEVVSGDTDVIGVDENGNAFIVRTVDYEAGRDTYEVTVLVKDKGTPMFSTNATIVLSLFDDDDNAPVFTESSPYTTTVPETAPVGQIIVPINATDADKPNTYAEQIEYHFSNDMCSPDVLLIDRETGDIIIKTDLDFESYQEINCEVIASSSGTSGPSNTANVTIYVTDVNDRVPKFNETYYQGSVLESKGPGTTITKVVADDPDNGDDGRVKYSIMSNIFRIEEVTGVVSLKKAVDFEKDTSFLVEITATDQGKPPKNSSVFLQVIIKPENEFAPEFHGPFEFDVKEDAVPGTLVFAVNATDKDRGLDGSLHYEIEQDVPFFIDADTGIVRVANNLDFDKPPNPIKFYVKAFDSSTINKKSNTITLTANILDVNDVAVTCKHMPTQIVNFPFDLGKILFSLSCDDPDEVASNLTYTISKGNDDGTFQIEASKGNISLASPPQSTLYTLTVNVNDGVDSVNVSFYVITETVLNFTNLPQTIPVNEEELSTVGLLFTAKQCCSFPPVSLTIMNRKAGEKVALFGSSGDLYLLVPYDRETQATYVYEIQAESTSGQTAIGRLTVNVLDINDNAPIFSDNVYEVSVMEDLSVSSIISQFMAMDKDEGMNSMLDYGITNGNIGGTFSINATGHITLDQPLDYETLNTYTLVIEAFDAGSSPLTGTTTVIISVKNADEFKPTLVPLAVPFTSSLREDEALGRSVFQVQVDDEDANITFTYSITSGNDDEDFNIVPETGYVYLAKLLDRERTPKYNITLTATDQNGVTKSGALEIEITDINDNNPVFSSAVYNLDINHGDPSGILLPALIVSDADFGSNAAIDVSIIEESIPLSFQLNGLQLESLITMDYTNVKRYRLVVKAEDNGKPQRTSTAVVVVNVLPALTQPKFSPDSGNVTYNEDINVGFEICDVDATVLGAVENETSMSYSIFGGDPNNDFRVVSHSGQILVNKPLDYEKKPQYTLKIKAQSNIDASMEDDFTLTVNVNNVNEHFPVFGQDSFSFDVDEDASPSTPVGTVTATDDDDGILGRLTYSITGNEFSVDPVTGEIKVEEPLDYLTKSYYNLILTAEDGDTKFPKATKVSVVIRVKDVNNNPPVFISGTSVEVLDSIPIGSEVFQFRATDIDTNEIISYSISIPDPTNGKFSLDPNTGILKTDALLDVTDSPYILSVDVSDGVYKTNTTLYITVVAANPNFYDPVLVGPINVQKDRQTVMGADVATVLATDADDGNSGEVLYRITSGNNDGYFIIDASSGKITAATTFLNAENYYSLVVVAKDRGIPQRSASTTVNVVISPQKTISITPDYQFSIKENSTINSLVGKIDKDFDRTVSAYNVTSGNWNNAFTVTRDASDNGEIKVSSPLDYEVYQTYSLLIHVTTDIGVLPKFIQIQVEDVNDNPPVFASSSLALSVYEGSPIGYIVETISYTDADTLPENTNNMLTLKDPGPSYFKINKLGELSLTVVPDYKINPSIVFDIVADDMLSSATVTVTVNILDLEEVEEVSPSTVTENALISLEVPFPSSSGHLIHTLTPGDFGMTTSSTATYEYVSYDFSDPFSVDARTGQLTVSSPSLLEDQSKYFHWVMCRALDSGNTESRVSLIRIDTFNRNTQMIVIELAESLTTVQSSLNTFRSRTQVFFSSPQRVGFSNLFDTSTSSRRRLLAAQTAIYTYVVSDTSADDMAKINQPKTFLSEEDILKVLQQSVDGTPTPGLSSSSLDVATVSPFQETESGDSNSFFDSTAAIVLLCLLGLLLLIGIILLVWCCCLRKDKKGSSNRKD